MDAPFVDREMDGEADAGHRRHAQNREAATNPSTGAASPGRRPTNGIPADGGAHATAPNKCARPTLHEMSLVNREVENAA